MSKEQVKARFEEFNRAALQAAVNLIGETDRVDRITVYVLVSGHSVETTWYFGMDGALLSPTAASEALGVDAAANADLAEECDAEETAFLKALIADGDLPQRIISTYDPQSGRTVSDWDYEGVLEGDDDTAQAARDRWAVAHGGKPLFG